ncbi:cyclic nucleotide-binding domain-containing protein [Sulfurimonas sp.]
MIRKTSIIDGLSYIEIPEADVYIQCGSPAESVKHLIKHNIIETMSKHGVTYETGPNAILLSDMMIQNGEFSNMSEFSVLQMLYRQGMIIPNHPNNTGLKPILIGSDTQVNAQMNYIFRGNYGLISQEEIEACGIESDRALELMNMKLKFAFGELQSADNLLESCIVEKEKIEIRNNVFIQRKEHNVFVISYKNDSVEVDLNLTKKQTYASPYTLPQYKIKRDYFSVIHTGQGNGWDIDRPSMNSIISFQGKLYAIDVVPNFKHILDALSIDINEIEGVFQTHNHDDHLAGITSLIRSDKKIKFYASKLVLSSTAKKLSALLNFDESEFYNLVDAKELEIDEWNDIDGLEVKPYISPHPVETTIFVFRTLYGDGYKTYGHFADIVDLDILKSMISHKIGDIGISKHFYDEVKASYMQTLDLKKIDIGGGMIHGSAKNFADDKTSKIVLAHIERDLNHDEKRIGSGSLFGLSDILIPSNNHNDLSVIYKYIKSNFPNIHNYKRKVFLNFNVVEFNPEAIIIREGEIINNVYLILSGQIEKVKENINDNIILTPGLILGEKAALTKELSRSTYIAKNFVKLLEIPVDFFRNFIYKNDLVEDLIEKSSKRYILQKTDLFEEAIAYSTLNKIIGRLKEEKFKKGILDISDSKLYIVISGEVIIKVNNTIVETLTEFDYFGGTQAILDYSSACSFEAIKETVLCNISGSFLIDIPIVRWKILEKNELRKQKLLKNNIKNVCSH